MRAALSIALLAAMLGAALSHGAARAQSLVPETMPWEKKLKEYYARQQRILEPNLNPYAQSDAALKRLYEDPALRLGLPPNRLDTDEKEPAAEAPPLPTTLDPGVARLDADGDGTISRSEYFLGRQGPVPAGRSGMMRQELMNRRLDSRFRGLDANGDGRISVDEYAATPGARF